MNILEATRNYEAWLRQRIPLLEDDLALKHQRMAEAPFPFLRATFYRWAQRWPEVVPDLASGPLVLGVGDLHIENFGTWRDQEGGLVWGVNDFDEACPLPYTNDLVRLAVSARLAMDQAELECDVGLACQAILEGYQDGLQKGGQPFVLADRHVWLRELASSQLRDPVRFWEKLNRWPDVTSKTPPEVKQALQRAFPSGVSALRIVHRQAGLGSLGRRRFTALAEWGGGWIAREAKELRVSAWNWERPAANVGPLLYQEIVQKAIRCADPGIAFQGSWLLRRLAPDCSRIELSSLPKSKDEARLLQAMGLETANIHLGTRGAAAKILADLAQRPAKWLRKSTEAMAEATLDDWKAWKRSTPGG